MKRFFNVVLFIGIILGLSACSQASQDLVFSIDGQENVVTKQTFQEIEKQVNVDEEKDYDLSLEYLFYKYGVKAVDEINIVQGDTTTTFPWSEVADAAYWRNVREVEINGKEYLADKILISCSELEMPVAYSVTDIAPISAAALGIPFGNEPLPDLPYSSAGHVVWFFLDGFGYEGFQYAKQAGLIPNLSTIGQFYPAYTVYPSKTSVVTAALLSGLDSQQNGVWASGIRNLTVPSIIEALVDAGKKVTVIEGSSTPFNYPDAEIILSGDRNGDGSTDDNVAANAREFIATGIPDLLMIHFHGVDDVGHTYGPYTPEWRAKVAEVDAMVAELIMELPENTLIFIFPDHGMHAINEDSELGNHGNLLLEDMATYIILFQK
jgi:hypothetical protein